MNFQLLTILAVLAALTLPHGYKRYQAFQLISHNSPENLIKVANFAHHEIKFADKIRNCEDALLVEDKHLALLSCDPGRDHWNTVMGTFNNPTGTGGKIWVYDYAGSGDVKPLKLLNFDLKESTFHPLGIEFWAPTNTLYVINHGMNISTIEKFSVDFSKSTATHVRSFAHALVNYPNSLALVGEDEFFVTNDHFIGARSSKTFAQVETYLAPPLASIVYVNMETRQVAVSGRVAWANGVTMINSFTLAVASTSTPGVYLYSYDPDTKILINLTLIPLPFFPDNLSTDSDGTLLIAGHPHPPSLAVVAETNHQFQLDGAKDDAKRPRSPSWTAEWDIESREVRDIYVNDGSEFGSSSTIVRDKSRGVGIITGLYEKGILVWKK